MRLFLKSQSVLEFCVLFVVVAAALLTMQAYMKRGIQGRWKESVDQLGEPYDPYMGGSTTYMTTSDSSTDISVSNGITGRIDTENSVETKTESLSGSM